VSHEIVYSDDRAPTPLWAHGSTERSAGPPVPEVPVEDAPASSNDRYERWLVAMMTANGHFLLAAGRS
jgi:hypothetical protein